MITLDKDRKNSNIFIITKTDGEGFHHQLWLTRQEMEVLAGLINKVTE